MSNNLRDEEFELFIENFGEATTRESVSGENLDKWKGRLPDRLLKYWQLEGWSAYNDGFFWFVNPDLYEDIVDLWLEGTPYKGTDSYHVIARSAFGVLLLWGEEKNQYLKIAPLFNAIYGSMSKSRKKSDSDISFCSFLLSQDRSHYDLKDVSKQPLFKRVLAKLGPLSKNEMYAFEPALVLGGDIKLENLVKVDSFVHNDILRGLAPPIMPMLEVDFKQMAKVNS